MYNAFMIKAAGIDVIASLAAVIVADQHVMMDTTQISQGVVSNGRSLAITVACCAWPVLNAVLFPLMVASSRAFPRKRRLELISKPQFT